MIKELLFSFKSPSRDDLNVYGFRFGNKKEGYPKIAIVSGMNGEEIAGVFSAAQLVHFLQERETLDPNFINGEVLIIPSVNHFALNMGKRFWPLDNTDINVMFPGYDKGETTQRIAFKLFEAIKDFNFGIVIEDRKDKADCMPYIRLIDSNYMDIEGAKSFGLQFIHTKKFEPVDSGSLLYNWEVWGAKAYSIVFSGKKYLFQTENDLVLDALIRFISIHKIINLKVSGGYKSDVVSHENVEIVKSPKAGIFKPIVKTGIQVREGQLIGIVYDSLSGEVKSHIHAKSDGIVSCMYSDPLIFQQTIVFRIVKFNNK